MLLWCLLLEREKFRFRLSRKRKHYLKVCIFVVLLIEIIFIERNIERERSLDRSQIVKRVSNRLAYFQMQQLPKIVTARSIDRFSVYRICIRTVVPHTK